MWARVLERDRAADGQFVYAVRSTGIYCRPSCPSRRPAPGQVKFFPTIQAAELAGFRACLRCRPTQAAADQEPHKAAVVQACDLLGMSDGERVELNTLAARVGLSRYVLLRAFKRILGVTPAEYARQQRHENFRRSVQGSGTSVTEAMYASGFGSSSRLYETSRDTLGMRPSTIREQGKGATIRFATGDSPLGRMLVAATDVGICAVAFGDTDAELERELRARFSAAHMIERDQAELADRLREVLRAINEPEAAAALPLDVRQTAFRERAWRAMREIRQGETRTYGELAAALGEPKAARAVGTACAENPVAVLIPCHRVLAADRKVENWRWGKQRKRQLLEMEAKAAGAEPQKL